jgi:4-amino-4-deoxy-L-arabinose transferase-like glycosyltransferase
MSSSVTGARRFPAPPDQQQRGRLARLLRGPEHDPRWARPGLLGLLVATAILYTAGLSRNGWANDFYSAAVQAGATSWKAFFFGSFDSSSFITVDKTPASLWVMDLSVRLFGLNSWSVLLPQAAEGVAAVGILYAAVRRWAGPAAGLIAAAALACTPVATLMFRFNNPDALLVLLMTAAAYALVRAIESGRTRWLVLAGALLGFGFLTKMLQAFLVLPGFALVYLVAGPPRLLRRCWQLLAGGAALLAAAGWWVAIVMLTPAADRPYVGGSTNDSILQLALGYNGLGRLDGNETGSVGPGAGHGGSAAFSGAAGLTRLFAADMGGQISWLLPAALISLAGLLWLTWRRPRTDRLRAAALLWGGWLLITGLVFSYMNGIIHPYYTVALAPAIAALVGMGAVTAWRARSSLGVRLALAAAVLVTAWWAYSLLDRSASWLPWLRVLVVACGLAAAAVIVAEHWVGGPARTVLGAVLPLALLSGLAGPLAYSLDTAATAHTGALPSAGPSVTSFGGPGGGFGAGRPGGGFGAGRPGGGFGAGRAGAGFGGQAGPGGSAGQRPGGAGGRTGGPGGLAGNTQVSSAIIKLLTSGASGYRWAAATVGAESAAPFQLASREPIMAIGGFNGTDAAPSLAEFKDMVAGHEIHYFIGANSDTFGGGAADAEAITTWVSTHFSQETAGGETVYNLAHSSSS